MSTYEVISLKRNNMSTYETILRNINHVSTYETILCLKNPHVDMWNHAVQYKPYVDK